MFQTPGRKNRSRRNTACSGLVEEGGFEPPKRNATDLQSAPFGHSGTPPYSIVRPSSRRRRLTKSEPSEAGPILRGEARKRSEECPCAGVPNGADFASTTWSWWTDSNPRPADYKSAALPAELHQQIRFPPTATESIPKGEEIVKSILKTFPPGSRRAAVPGGERRGGRNTVQQAEGLRPALRDSQGERPRWLCPVCGAEQYCRDRGRLWRGRRVCAACFSRIEEKEEDET